MSRVAKAPIVVPTGVEITLNGQEICIKGNNGQLTRCINQAVKINYLNNILIFIPRENYADGWAQAGTARSTVNSMILGVTEGFVKKLQLFGVGYRAYITKNNFISLVLGFSHPIEYKLPLGVSAICPNQNEIVLNSADKQLIGQVAANLRAYRPPEPYKGKGIRYVDEIVRIKESKKK